MLPVFEHGELLGSFMEDRDFYLSLKGGAWQSYRKGIGLRQRSKLDRAWRQWEAFGAQGWSEAKAKG